MDFVTANGFEFEAGPSRDGKGISASLNKRATTIRNIEDIAGPRGRENQFAVSFQAFAELVALERDKPGRKIILWVSHGWPPVVRPDFEHMPSEKQNCPGGLIGNLWKCSRTGETRSTGTGDRCRHRVPGPC